MALVDLEIPFADVTAEQLRIAIDGQVPEMLASAELLHDRNADIPPLTLGILGSSHVAFVGKQELPEFVEELSCTASGGRPLSKGQAGAKPGEPTVEIARDLDLQQLSGAVAAIGARVTHGQNAPGSQAILASFPGSDLAITALVAETTDSGYRWTSWHAYPPSVIVTTTNSWEIVDDE